MANNLRSAESPSAEGGPTEAPPSLPRGWIAQWDAKARKYYYVQISTGTSTWDVPTEAASGVPTRDSMPMPTTPSGSQFQTPGNPPPSSDSQYDQTRGEESIAAGGLGGMAMNALVGGRKPKPGKQSGIEALASSLYGGGRDGGGSHGGGGGPVGPLVGATLRGKRFSHIGSALGSMVGSIVSGSPYKAFQQSYGYQTGQNDSGACSDHAPPASYQQAGATQQSQAQSSQYPPQQQYQYNSPPPNDPNRPFYVGGTAEDYPGYGKQQPLYQGGTHGSYDQHRKNQYGGQHQGYPQQGQGFPHEYPPLPLAVSMNSYSAHQSVGYGDYLCSQSSTHRPAITPEVDKQVPPNLKQAGFRDTVAPSLVSSNSPNRTLKEERLVARASTSRDFNDPRHHVFAGYDISLVFDCNDPRMQGRLLGLIHLLLRRFDQFRSCIQPEAGKSSSSSGRDGIHGPSRSSTSSRLQQRNQQKRKRGDNNDQEEEEDPERPNGTPVPAKRRKEAPYLACPFFKFNRFRYNNCGSKVMQGIHRVTQHLTRPGSCHHIPIHCSSCYREFKHDEDRSEHERQRSCNPIPCKSWDGCVDSKKREEMRSLVRKNKTNEENWFAIYSCLFPQAKPPDSPYPDIEESGELEMFRDFVSAEAPGIVDEFMKHESQTDPEYRQIMNQTFLTNALPHCINMLFERYNSKPSASIEHGSESSRERGRITPPDEDQMAPKTSHTRSIGHDRLPVEFASSANDSTRITPPELEDDSQNTRDFESLYLSDWSHDFSLFGEDGQNLRCDSERSEFEQTLAAPSSWTQFIPLDQPIWR